MALAMLPGCPDLPKPIAPELDGPDVFFNRDRLTRIIAVEMADRAAVLREYVGQRITARMDVSASREVASGSPGSLRGRYVLDGRAAGLSRTVAVLYTIYFDDPSVLRHKVRERIEVTATIRDVAWETRGGGQALRVTGLGTSLRRFDR